jgi:SAM-dependent methyltransferase
MTRAPLVLLLLSPLLLALACASPASKTAPAAGREAAALGPEPSVRPGVNAPFLAPDVDVGEFVKAFEGESREIAQQCANITLHLGLKPGMTVADVGAGTGLFMSELAHGVGPAGRVYEIDIAPAFVEHLRERARSESLGQVEVVQCTERSVELPAGSVDVALVCDTYHHFEYPQSTLASLREALKPGGVLAVVDFERRPDSRPWVLEHVRCGSEQVIAEIEAAGFHLEDRPAVPGLSENYLLRFRKREP